MIVDKKQNELFSELEKVLSEKLVTLLDKPEESVRGTLCALWQLASGNPMSVEKVVKADLSELSEAQEEKLKQSINLRLSGKPLAHITGRQQFMGIEFLTGTQALVPRKETELLGFAALNILKKIMRTNENTKVIDVCTGSGNLALAIAKYIDGVDVYAADLSADAIALARKNSDYMGMGDRVNFYIGDLLKCFSSDEFYNAIDLLICNPPYISSGKVKTMPEEIIEFEPGMAFDGGVFGINIINRLIQEAPEYIREGGWLAFEIGHGQGELMLKRLKKNKKYTELVSVNNDDGITRAILAKVTHTGSRTAL